MERKIVQGKTYVFESVFIQDRTITLAGIVSSINPQMVEFITPVPQDQPNVVFPIDEFMRDLKFFAEYIDKHGYDDEDFKNSFLVRVEEHINDFGRIILDDLLAYLHKILILQRAVYENYGGQLSPENAAKTWDKFYPEALLRFLNNIYVREYDSSDPSMSKPYFVKLRDSSNYRER